uniref:Uncharacterized protein MANES_12G148500 n=1 Tax=Rhizophora mucronata TaxID=61149 RepID=A0A2P2JFD2_RHIMU
MQIIPRWRNALILQNTLAVPTSSRSRTNIHFASIHSTPSAFEKWKSKWSADVKGNQQPSKSHIRYAIRQKRADAKRALRNLIFNSGSSRASFQAEDQARTYHAEHQHNAYKKRQSKASAQGPRKSNHKKKCEFRRENFSEDYDKPETIFQATFGNKWYTWSFDESSFRRSKSGFEWREHASWRTHGTAESNTSTETESDNDSCSVGSYFDRTILGLPPTGPLTIEDVKKAFRTSALKWHPDKHQGPSQAVAEEKFKVCVNAYKSLCTALS